MEDIERKEDKGDKGDICMSSCPPCLPVSFQVGRFTAEVSLKPVGHESAMAASVRWSPRPPRFDRDFNAAQRAEYQVKLIAAVLEVSA